MVRTIVTPANTNIQLSVPQDYVGKQVEVTFIALDEFETTKETKTLGDFFGSISEEVYQGLKKHTEQVRK
jgi:DTW domain-containing protein YfiP